METLIDLETALVSGVLTRPVYQSHDNQTEPATIPQARLRPLGLALDPNKERVAVNVVGAPGFEIHRTRLVEIFAIEVVEVTPEDDVPFWCESSKKPQGNTWSPTATEEPSPHHARGVSHHEMTL